MSVLVITTLAADAAVIREGHERERRHACDGISDEARGRREPARHLFADDGAGNVLIVDEWDSRESFDAFFGSQPEIGRLMQEVGVSGPPSTTSRTG